MDQVEAGLAMEQYEHALRMGDGSLAAAALERHVEALRRTWRCEKCHATFTPQEANEFGVFHTLPGPNDCDEHLKDGQLDGMVNASAFCDAHWGGTCRNDPIKCGRLRPI